MGRSTFLDPAGDLGSRVPAIRGHITTPTATCFVHKSPPSSGDFMVFGARGRYRRTLVLRLRGVGLRV